MAEFSRMSAAEADTELRGMRQALLKRQTELQEKNESAIATTRRIQAINRALQSLAAEKPEQLTLLNTPPTKKPAAPTRSRSPYGG
ncbi:hypothetical protein [Hymenobacter saemangeumensis]